LVLIEWLFFDIAAHLSFGFGNAPRELGINLRLPFPLPAIVFSPFISTRGQSTAHRCRVRWDDANGTCREGRRIGASGHSSITQRRQ
jgi:hypothetical protein